MSQYPYQTPPPATQTSTLALVSLISGILTWVMLPLLGAIVAIITGHMAKSEIKKSMGALSGDGLATAGLVLGYLQVGISVLCACAWLAMMALGLSVPLLEGSY